MQEILSKKITQPQSCTCLAANPSKKDGLTAVQCQLYVYKHVYMSNILGHFDPESGIWIQIMEQIMMQNRKTCDNH